MAPAVLAFAQLQAVGKTQSSPSATAAGQTAVNLKPIMVMGHKVPVPVALQMIKAALKRPVSFSHENLGKLVCQFDGFPFAKLDCHTNCQLWARNMRLSGVYVATGNCYGWRGPSESARMAASVADRVDRSRIKRGALLKLLKKLPPAGSSYTLRITDHGKVVAEYVFKDGKLVKVWKAKDDKK